MDESLQDLICQTKNGFWYVKGDTLLPGWIETAGRLDHDRWALDQIEPYIKPGSIVIDVGANIGTHTVAYLNAVGSEGIVCAYEPFLPSYECLIRNCPKAAIFDYALSDAVNGEFMNVITGNPGANYLSRSSKTGAQPVEMTTLDREFLTELAAVDSSLPVSFIKIDVEGCEPEILRGGRRMIERERPAFWIEINPGALERRGNHAMEIKTFLDQHNYRYEFCPPNCTWTSPQCDLLCIPK